METHMKTEVVWLPSHEDIVVKQEKDEFLEISTNSSGSSCKKLLECKIEKTHEIDIKEEPQEPIEDEELSSLGSEHANQPKFEPDDTLSIKEDCKEENCFDSDKFTGFSKTNFFEKNNHNERMECSDRHDSVDEYPKKNPSTPVGHENRQIGEKRFVCDFCHKTFNKKHDLTRHIRTHTGDKPFSCEVCGKRFTVNGGLTTHRRIHKDEKPFSCDLCHKQFTVRGSLITHKRTHIGEKPFSCDLCDKKFTMSGALTIHKRIHTGEKPFSCDLCHKKFTQKGVLTKHKRIHAGEQPFLSDLSQTIQREGAFNLT